MKLKDFTEEIDGKRYKTIVFPSRQGLDLKTRVIKFIGPLFNNPVNTQNAEVDLNNFISKISSSEVSNLIIELLSQTWYVEDITKGHVIDESFFDEHFAGEYFHLYKVVWFVIRSNGFFGKGNIGEMLKSLGVKTPTILPNDSTKTF